MNARDSRNNGAYGGNRSRGSITPPSRSAQTGGPQPLSMKDIPTILQQPKPATQPSPQITRDARRTLQQNTKQTLLTPTPAPIPVPEQSSPPPPATKPDDMASVRQQFGFDDIPILSPEEMANQRGARQLFGDWAKQLYQSGVSPDKRRKLSHIVRNNKLVTWKEDLKWALKADSDKDEPQPVTKAPAPAPVNIQPRTPRLHVAPRSQFGAVRPAVPMSQPQPAPSPDSKRIDISISFGSMPKMPKMPKIPSLRQMILAIRRFKFTKKSASISAACAVVLLFVAPPLFAHTNIGGIVAHSTSIQTEKIEQKPDYQTITPAGKNVEQDGGWKRVSPPSSDPVFAFADKINDVVINVSQQPIPENFKPNVEESIKEMAAGFNATDKVSAGGTSMYIGTSVQGPQSVILTKNNLLILIKSTDEVATSDWAKYVQSMN